MAGTKDGGKKAAATNKQRYGLDYYEKTGREGGHNSHVGGFGASHELAVEAGKKGGAISRRGPSKPDNGYPAFYYKDTDESR